MERRIVAIVGSSKFKAEHLGVAQKETLQGADQWRAEMTAELIALRTIVLRLGSAVREECRSEVEALEREWHSACLSENANPRIAESKYKEAKASYEAVERAMVVLEAARNRDEKAQSDDARR